MLWNKRNKIFRDVPLYRKRIKFGVAAFLFCRSVFHIDRACVLVLGWIFGFLFGFRHRTPMGTALLPTIPSPLSSPQVLSWCKDSFLHLCSHYWEQILSHHTGLGSSFLVQLACKSSPQSCDTLEWPKGLRFSWVACKPEEEGVLWAAAALPGHVCVINLNCFLSSWHFVRSFQCHKLNTMEKHLV